MKCPTCGCDNETSAEACFSCGRRLRPAPIVKGSVVASRYEVLQPIGKGGMGLVFKARDLVLGELVALKLLRSDLTESEELARRFRTEIRLARKVRHKNVCGIHEYGEDGTLQYIAMEYIDGVDLRQLQKTRPVLPAEEALKIAVQIGQGLQAIHETGIIHRDMKSSNIMLDAKGVIRLMDFGIAKQTDSETSATATGTIVGTPEYMSPEQARGEKLDHRSDLYSLGILIYELFTGHVPFKGDTPLATVLKQLQDPVPLEGGMADRIPPAVKAILLRTLSKERAQRPESATKLVAELEAVLGGVRAPATAAVERKVLGAGAEPEPIPETEALVTPVPTAVPTAVETRVPAPAWAAQVPIGAGPRGAGPLATWGLAGALVAAVAGIGLWWAFARGGSESPASPTQTVQRNPQEATVPPERPVVIVQEETAVSLPPEAAKAQPGPGVAASTSPEAGSPSASSPGRAPSQQRAKPETTQHQNPEETPPAKPARASPKPSKGAPTGRSAKPVTSAPSQKSTAAPPAPGATHPRPTPGDSPRAGMPLTAAPAQSSVPEEGSIGEGTSAKPATTASPGPVTTEPDPRAPTPSLPVLTPTPLPKPVDTAAPTPPKPVGRGLLVIKVKPKAEIHVDGEVVGVMSAYTAALTEGPHTIRFVHKKYQALQRTVHVIANERGRLVVDLKDEAIRRK